MEQRIINTFRWLRSAAELSVPVITGTAVAQWLRYCATNQKVAGSIPDGILEFFIDINPSIALRPWGQLNL
jgi:hypothetical protein